MTKEKAMKTLDKLRSLGFEEFWPPSRRVWHFRNTRTGIDLDFFWMNYTFKAWFYGRERTWSDKYKRWIY